MEVLNAFIIAGLEPLTVVLKEGQPALSLNRKFWPCLVAGLFLPSIVVVIILSRRAGKIKELRRLPTPVSSEEIFDPVLQLNEPRMFNENSIQFLARA